MNRTHKDRLLAFAILVGIISGCGDDSDTSPTRDTGSATTDTDPSDSGFIDMDAGPATSGMSLMDRAREAGLTDFAILIESAPAVFGRLVDDSEDLTLLAPTNEALASATLPSDPYEVETLLLHHLVEGRVDRAALLSDPVSQTSARTWVEVDASAESFGGAILQPGAPVSASNGQLFVLDGIVTPPTVTEALDRDPEAMMLRVYLTTARAQGAAPLRVDGDDLTFLAPTDSALAQFPFIELTAERIFAAMQNMTLEGIHPSSSLVDGSSLTSPEGGVSIEVEGNEVTFTDAQNRSASVVEADIRAGNGVIHRVDGAFLSL